MCIGAQPATMASMQLRQASMSSTSTAAARSPAAARSTAPSLQRVRRSAMPASGLREQPRRVGEEARLRKAGNDAAQRAPLQACVLLPVALLLQRGSSVRTCLCALLMLAQVGAAAAPQAQHAHPQALATGCWGAGGCRRGGDAGIGVQGRQ